MKLAFITFPRLLSVVDFGREIDAENYVGPFPVVNDEAIIGGVGTGRSRWLQLGNIDAGINQLLQWILKIDISEAHISFMYRQLFFTCAFHGPPSGIQVSLTHFVRTSPYNRCFSFAMVLMIA